MGVAVTCKKTGDTIDMGYGGFLQLRRRVSDLCGEPWASHYRELTDNWRHPDGWEEAFNAKTQELLDQKVCFHKGRGFPAPIGCRRCYQIWCVQNDSQSRGGLR